VSADKTAIEWTDSTWNPIRARRKTLDSFGRGGIKVGWHCEHVSEGCRFCYAEGINRRLGTGLDFKPGHRGDIEIFLDEKMLLAPLRWRKPRDIFVCSMTDLFADFVRDEWIDRMFAMMALCRQHRFQVLTKRPKRMRAHVQRPEFGNEVEIFPWPLPNVWLGISAEDQANADERIPELLATPAAVRFVSLEPLLGPIDLGIMRGGLMHPRISWVICGGESGPHARLMRPEWIRLIRDQCAAAGVPFFFKQWGEYEYMSEFTGGAITIRRVGKRAAGRLLDGVEHSAMPGNPT